MQEVKTGLEDTLLRNASSFLLGLKFVYSELSVTTCGPEFNFLVLSDHYYFFLSGGTNEHIIHHELGAGVDNDFGGEKKILERQICELSIENK